MKISNSAAQAFANFVEVMEQEHGIKIDGVDCWVHNQKDNKDHVKAALDMAEGKYQDAANGVKFIKAVHEVNVWGLSDLEVYVYANDTAIDEIVNDWSEEEEEEAFEVCEMCQTETPKDEKHSAFTEHVCEPCGNAQMEEWEREKEQEQSDYRNDVL
jgi:hypothetical protein